MNWLLVAWIACQSLDVGTTAYALNSGRFVEANPAMRGPHLYAVKIGVNVGGFAFHKLALEKRRGGQGWIMPVAFASAGCAAGGLNLHTIASARH